MKLKDFFDINKTNKTKFSKEAKITRMSLYNFINGSSIPENYNFKKIFQSTNGAVEPNDFFPLDEWKKELLTKKGENL